MWYEAYCAMPQGWIYFRVCLTHLCCKLINCLTWCFLHLIVADMFGIMLSLWSVCLLQSVFACICAFGLIVTYYIIHWTSPVPRGGGSEKSNSVGGFETPPPFFENGLRGGFKGVFRRRHIICANFFSWYSFGLHIQSFVLAPNLATFDFVPLARDPP